MPPSNTAISVKGLSKVYAITRGGERHSTLAETMLHRLVGGGKSSRPSSEPFHALQDLTFDVAKGDVVGVIGKNGAGKSTFLKVLSRITDPTQGTVDVYGHIGSLLEVGTGFHPELTGSENIYLNGAILGMKRSEIRAQFDAIVDFAGVAQFLDTPVKRYSSGMYVRLAFAVAAHLRSSILLIDEVLAVGDQAFQQKCLGKMRDVAADGRTILFVSHHMQSTALLCNKGLHLQEGRMMHYGNIHDAIESYQRTTTPPSASATLRRPGTGEYRITSAQLSKPVYACAEEKAVHLMLKQYGSPVGRLYLSAHLVTTSGQILAQFDSRLIGTWLPDVEEAEVEFSFSTPWPKPGNYRIDLFICAVYGVIDSFENAVTLCVSEMLPYPCTASSDGCTKGEVLGSFDWKLKN